MNQDDIPLTNAFYENPLDYMQNYVRNLNNEIFLSQYHINNLYALLLIGRNSPWDNIRGNNSADKIKEEIDLIVNQKVIDVKSMLESLSNMYEDKVKKSAITQIEKLMGILKSKKKSIFIEKDKRSQNFKNFHLLQELATHPSKEQENNNQNKQEQFQIDCEHHHCQHQLEKEDKSHNKQVQQQIQQQIQQQNIYKHDQQIEHSQKPKIEEQKTQLINQPDEQIKIKEHHHQHMCQHPLLQPGSPQKKQQETSNSNFGGKQVFGIFYGLANLSNLSALALTNALQYNSAQRFIKFKMSQNYIMTIKNGDPLYFDRTSRIAKVSGDLFVNHLFPYLSASELFNVRSVCKEWLDNVKDSWHATFKREMFVQLLACEFCKDIQFFYKTIQLRNPFFQKLSLLIHALIEIIQWDNVYAAINTNSLTLQLKRILIIILRLIGQPIILTNLNAINQAFFEQHKHRLTGLKQKVTQFFSTLSGSDLSINDLRQIKALFLDDPFMRVQQLNSEDKSPLLLTLFVKQMTLQQILRNHIFLSQQYLLNTKRRLDNISKKIVYQKGYLEGVYKILLLKSSAEPNNMENQPSQMPNFSEMLQSIFTNKNSQKPDFVIKNRFSSTEIFLDNATKLDIILSTVYNLKQGKTDGSEGQQEITQENGESKEQKQQHNNEQSQISTEKISKNQISMAVDLKIDCQTSNQEAMAESQHIQSTNPDFKTQEQHQ